MLEIRVGSCTLPGLVLRHLQNYKVRRTLVGLSGDLLVFSGALWGGFCDSLGFSCDFLRFFVLPTVLCCAVRGDGL